MKFEDGDIIKFLEAGDFCVLSSKGNKKKFANGKFHSGTYDLYPWELVKTLRNLGMFQAYKDGCHFSPPIPRSAPPQFRVIKGD
jgi:hypothetical protein